MTSPGLPATWPDLIAQDRPEVEGRLTKPRERRVEANEIVDGGGSAGRTLLGIPSLLAEVAIVSGPAACLDIIELWEPILQAAPQLAGAPIQDVMPVTENFIDRLPYERNAGSLRFYELLFADRAVLSQIVGSSEGTVGVEMHRIVTNLA